MRFLLVIGLLAISCPAWAGYTIKTLPYTYKYVTANGPKGKVQRIAPTPSILDKANYKGIAYIPTDFDPYSTVDAQRTVLLHDDHGATSAGISALAFQRLPGIRAWKAEIINIEGDNRINRLAPPSDGSAWDRQAEIAAIETRRAELLNMVDTATDIETFLGVSWP